MFLSAFLFGLVAFFFGTYCIWGIWPPRWIGILGPREMPFVTVIFLYVAAVTCTYHAMQCIRYSICFDFFYCTEGFVPFFFGGGGRCWQGPLLLFSTIGCLWTSSWVGVLDPQKSLFLNLLLSTKLQWCGQIMLCFWGRNTSSSRCCCYRFMDLLSTSFYGMEYYQAPFKLLGVCVCIYMHIYRIASL